MALEILSPGFGGIQLAGCTDSTPDLHRHAARNPHEITDARLNGHADAPGIFVHGVVHRPQG